ncbi:DUF6517 family protein [Halorarum salinum]|uniref:Uncharacterized protein n=1 Tax=Halorarum salinum TaxID=2743089 RepID=A0A7D5LCT7_9EURY|nr:DUF6517 family protein [Halobaculum salinum]QLG63488.1 hypothetical protein HUG12_17850 [Halobaculum salinum]
MDSRRTFLRAVGAIGLAGASAGCIGVITGEEPAGFSAGVATVPSATLEETGYEPVGVEDVEVERTFSVAGQERRVVVTNRLAQYDKAVELPTGDSYQGALFAALTTPAVEVFGRTMNPVAELGSGELARRALGEFEGFGDLREDGTETATVLGSETEVGLFLTDAEIAAGVTAEVRIHVAEAVRAGEDFVVAIGAYPTLLSGEDDHVRTMMGDVEHADD